VQRRVVAPRAAVRPNLPLRPKCTSGSSQAGAYVLAGLIRGKRPRFTRWAGRRPLADCKSAVTALAAFVR
jgi:hypothetical protein